MKRTTTVLFIILAMVVLGAFSPVANAQVDVTATGGTLSASYTTLKGAFDAINAGTHTGTITIGISGNTTEAASAVLNASGSGSASYTSITVNPTGGAARTISGSLAAGILIDLNGADNVTIDGLNTGGNSLTISNTSTSSTSGTATIRFQADATNNKITNCSILGSATISVSGGTNGGNIWFGAASTTTGSDGNKISFCDIGPAGANLPTRLIWGNGTTTTAAQNNSNDTVTNCNLFDFFIATAQSRAVDLSSGNTDWVISNNRIYQTATRTWTTGAEMRGISISNSSSGNNFLVSGNTIGYSSSAGTGTYTITGSTNLFKGIFMSVGTTTASSVQGNTITAISQTTTTSGTSTSSPCILLYVSTGLVNVGNVSGNTIGDLNGATSVSFSSSSTSTSDVYAHYNFSSSNTTCSNNSVGNITVTNSSTGSVVFFGLRINTLSSVSLTMSNNRIGSTSGPISNNATATSSRIVGIQNDAAAATITGDTVRNMSLVAGNTGTGSSASIIGIVHLGATATGHTISRNVIHTLSNTHATAAVSVTGMFYSGSTSGTNVIEKNFIHSLTLSTTSITATIRGISILAGVGTLRNNMVRLGITAAGANITREYLIDGILKSATSAWNIFFNSVYIGGTGVGTASVNTAAFNRGGTSTDSLHDNILWNARSNSTTGGKHYAIVLGTGATTFSSNSNLLYASGTGGFLGAVGATDYSTLAAWKSGTGLDGSSGSADPNFVNATGTSTTVNVHVQSATPADGNGGTYGTTASVTDDIDGDNRAANTPIDIGADAGSYTTVDIFPPAISYTTLGNTALTTNRSFTSVTITDVSGVDGTAGTRPRVYYKRSTDTDTWNDNTSGTAGWKYAEANGSSSPFDFTIDYSLLSGGGGVTTGNTVLYFVVAQDLVGTPNVAINSGSFAAAPTSVALTAAAFPIGGTVNSYLISTAYTGSYRIGTGETYTTLTNAGGFFAAINAGVVTGNVTANVVSNLTEDGTNALNQWSEEGGSGFTMTIKPHDTTTVERLISGAVANGMIRFNGADRVAVNGQVSGSGYYLRFRNTNTSNPTFTLLNDATRNSIQSCYVEGGNTSTSSGTILFSTSTGTSGNSNNKISDSFVRDRSDAAGVPANGIYSSGSGGAPNANDTISGVHVFNWTSSAILVTSTGAGDGWNISSSNLFQTASRTTALVALSIQGGSGHTITSTSIGGSVSNRSGTPITTTSTFTGMALAVGTGTTTRVFGNNISNLNISGGSTQTFKGITVTAGNVNIGTTSANTFGGGAAAYDTIRVSYDSDIIEAASSGTVNVQNNLVSNIAYYRNSGDRLAGITASAGTVTISANTVRNLSSNATASTTFFVRGINITAGTTIDVSNNQVYTIAQTNTASGDNWATGIYISSSATSITVQRNLVYDITAVGTGTGTSSPTVRGIHMNSGSATIRNNMIAAGKDVGNDVRVWAIQDGSTGTNNYYFNSVSTSGTHGAGANNSYAFNRSSSATVTIKDNIFSNVRSGGTGYHVAIANTNSVATGWSASASDYNVLYNAVAANLCQWLGSAAANNRTLSGWQASQGAGTPGSGGDANGQNADPKFVALNPNLHIDSTSAAGSPAANAGTPAGSVTTDYDNETRNASTPDIGADEFNLVAPSAFDLISPSGVDVVPSPTLRWRKAAGATRYDVYWGTGTPPLYANNVVDTFYAVSGAGGTTYNWEVYAENADSASGARTKSSNGPFSYTTANSPAPPSNLSLSNVRTDSVKLSWIDNAGGGNPEDSFYVYRNLDGAPDIGTPYTYRIAVLGPSTSPDSGGTVEYQDYGLLTNRHYYYRVSAKNSLGESGYSGADTTTLATTPGTPTFSNVLWNRMYIIVDSATNPSSTQYAIYNTQSSKYVSADGVFGNWTAGEVWRTYSQWGGATGTQLTGLTRGTLYTFRVKARNGGNVETAFGSDGSQQTTFDQLSTQINEGFENPPFPPTGWQAVQNDAGAQNWRDTTANVHGGSRAAYVRFESSVLKNDDWLITPLVQVPNLVAQLSFFYRAQSTSFVDSFEVWLSTQANGSTPAAFLSGGTRLYNNNNNNFLTYQSQTIDMSSYAGQQVYLAWRYDALDAFRLYLDDITLNGKNPANSIVVRKLKDADGSFGTSGDRTAKEWRLEIRRDSVNGTLVGSVNSDTMVSDATLLDGTYYAVEADSSGWRHLGYTNNGTPVTSSANNVQLVMSGGGVSREIIFVNTDVLPPNAPSNVTLTTGVTLLSAQARSAIEDLQKKIGASKSKAEQALYQQQIESIMSSPGSAFVDVGWTDNSATEDSFYIYRKAGSAPSVGPPYTDRVAVIPGLAGSGSTGAYHDAPLSLNTHYYYAVTASLNGLLESDPAQEDTTTLAETPGAPTFSDIRWDRMKIVVDTASNPPPTQFAIFNTQTGKFVSADGVFGNWSPSEVWRTSAQWGGPSGQQLTGLTRGTLYTFRVKARNQNNIETLFGSDASQQTTYDQPVSSLSEDFTSVTFPPVGWSHNRTDTLGWTRKTANAQPDASTGPAARMNFYSLTSGGTDTLKTPVLALAGSVAGRLTFYHAYRTYTTENDSMRVFASSDGGATWTGLLYNDGNTGMATLPPSTTRYVPSSSTDWRFHDIDIPAAYLTNSARIAFVGKSAFGNDLWVDNITIITKRPPNTLTVKKHRDIDGVLATSGDQVAKRWHLQIRADSATGALLGEVTSDTSVTVANLLDGTYYAIESDSAGWTHLGYDINGTPTASGANTVAVPLTGGGLTQTVTFVNLVPNTIIVRKVKDTDGDFGTTGDRTAKTWGLFVYRDSVSLSTLVAQGNTDSLYVGGLGDGTFIVAEADSLGWGHIGRISNGTPIAGSSRFDTAMVANGSAWTTDFANTKLSGVVVAKWRDADGGAPTFDEAKTWYLEIRKDSCNGALIAGGNATDINAFNITPGTYFAREADSAGWTHTGYRIDGGTPVGGTATCVQVVLGTGETRVVEFANFHPNTIIVNKLKDNDGDVTTTFDQSAKNWNLVLHSGSVSGPVVGSVASGSTLTVPNLGDGTYYATEADSAGWVHIGVGVDAPPSPSAANNAAVTVTGGGQTATVTFVNLRENNVTVRKFADADGDFGTGSPGMLFPVTLTIEDNGTAQGTLAFGVHPAATYCTDNALGEFEYPPPPPPDVFDIRLVDPRGFSGCMKLGLTLDLRPYTSPSQVDTYMVRFQPANPGGYPVTLSWPDLNATYSGPVRLMDGLVQVANMKTQTSYAYPAAGFDPHDLKIIAEGPNYVPPDRTPKQWALALYRGSVSPANLVTSANTTVLAIGGLGDGTYIACEEDSLMWTHLGRVSNGTPKPGPARYDTFSVANGSAQTTDFVNTRQSGILVQKFRDTDGGSVSFDESRSWFLTVRSGSCTGPVITSGNAPAIFAGGVTGGTYYVTEADSAGWTHAGYRIDNGAPVTSASTCVQVVIAAGETRIVDFANLHPNTIVVNKYRDLNGGSVSFDQTLQWGLSVTTQLNAVMGSGETTQLVVTGLADGNYNAVEADSVFWTHAGYRIDAGAGVPSGATSVLVSVADGQTRVVDFANMLLDTNMFRSFTPDDFATAVDQRGRDRSVRRVPDKVDFKFNLIAPDTATYLKMNFSMYTSSSSGTTSAILLRGKGKIDTLARWNDLKVVTYTTPIFPGDTFQVEGRGNKGRPLKVRYHWGTLPRPRSGWVTDFKLNVPRLPMPNEQNLDEEIYVQGGFPNGLTVGIPHPENAKAYGWVTATRPSDVKKSFKDRGGTHTGAPKCFDLFASGKPLVGQQRNLTPGKQSNQLFAEALALKLNIAASELGKTPPGFGELKYSDPGHPLDGKTIRQIGASADSFLSHCLVAGLTADGYDTVLSKINGAFHGDFDTLAFGTSLILPGVVRINDVPFLEKDPSLEPVIRVPLVDVIRDVPLMFALYQNYPNPFNPATTISFDLQEPSTVTLTVYNTLGQVVAELLENETMDEGPQSVVLDAGGLPSGVYFYRISATSTDEDSNLKYVSTKKMLLVK